MNREVIRNRTSDGHVPIEITPVLQRASSRQTYFSQQIVPDAMDQVDVDSTS